MGKKLKTWNINEIIFILKYKNIINVNDLVELFQVSANAIYLTIKRYEKHYKFIIKNFNLNISNKRIFKKK
jgi:hypothetical protein